MTKTPNALGIFLAISREIEGAWLDPPNELYLYGGVDKVE
jgi:hypothetical protein